ncbi:hypothetical protein BCR34DRAFT_28263 [Clohesyomyces aquaticus]|uniref:Uncharacterized protein n=1 Tax=Clohesyomyces aquaticus TaxID=1231657 RepID=A0A1Y1ZAK8_9PLEO|nr:hypothetical protein BCR34DRAFT_28263 [Clohesyomyces aquaticus]
MARMPMLSHIYDDPDPFARGAWLFIWSIIELTMDITATSLHSLKPLLASVVKTITWIIPYSHRLLLRSSKPPDTPQLNEFGPPPIRVCTSLQTQELIHASSKRFRRHAE